MSNWYQNEAVNSDIAVSSRIRIARNLKGIPFSSKMSLEQQQSLNKKVKQAITNSNSSFAKSLKYIEMRDIPENQRFAMVERHIISPEFAAKGLDGAIILSSDESISIMVGEEDHIRIQVILGGLNIDEAYNIADEIDTLLYNSLDFAFDSKLGFLTECPTNLGTGLRASVMLHLPALETSGEMESLSQSISKIGFTVRGMYGEGTKSLASLYQISNQITLGLSEKNALDNLKIITAQLIEKEKEIRNGYNKLKIEDLCFRALGLLQNSRILSSEEAMNLLSSVKLGKSMGILDIEQSPIKLLIESQPFMLMQKFGIMEADERDICRANMIRETLK